jgi:EAL domain-containing protein (putative c-di-GMP-specific phosphodiesterase class I)/DNA-binding NarL/FixJ family response regulator
MQPEEVEQILVIDDQKHVRLLLGKFLGDKMPDAQLRFYDPVSEGRPDAAFDWDAFDIVVLDINLGPGENGLDWLAEARAKGHSPATLVLTGEGDEETAVRAFELGALGYLSKLKLTKARLSEAIDKTLAKRDRDIRRSTTTQLRRSILNKSLFYARLNRSVKDLPQGQYAVLFLIAIDDYSALQSRAGLLEADRMATDVSDGICQALVANADSPSVTRIGDGIVAALVVGIPNITECHRDADAVIAEVEKIGERESDGALTVSIGAMCIAAGSDLSGDDWIRQADEACRLAGKQTGNSFHLDAAGGDGAGAGDGHRLFDVGEAIEANRLQCRFQPLAVMSDLMDWGDAQFYQLRVQIIGPNGVVYSPPEVVDSADLKRMLDRWVIREALSTVHANLAREPDGPPNTLSVLFAEPTLYDSTLTDWLGGLVRHLGSPLLAKSLTIEVSARDVMRDYPAAIERITDMRERLGVGVALVDLSLPDLLARCTKSLKFDYIRLQAGDMPEMGGGDGNRFEHDVQYIHDTGAAVIVERVESAAQLSQAVRFGVDFVQGFFLREAQDEILDDTIVDRFVV